MRVTASVACPRSRAVGDCGFLFPLRLRLVYYTTTDLQCRDVDCLPTSNSPSRTTSLLALDQACFTSTLPTSDNDNDMGKATLLSLPGELRNAIWREVVTSPTPLRVEPLCEPDKPRLHQPAAAFTCRLLRTEVLSIVGDGSNKSLTFPSNLDFSSTRKTPSSLAKSATTATPTSACTISTSASDAGAKC